MPDDCDLTEDPRVEIAALASTVISVLSDKPIPHAPALRASLVQKIVAATLSKQRFDAKALMKSLVDDRITAEQVVDHYLTEAARFLGAQWEVDKITFAEVTIAVSRLQGMITLAQQHWEHHALIGPSVLFVLPDDAHTFGAQVAVTQLRRLGAEVHLLFAPDHHDLQRAVQHGDHDLVLFTCARPEGLATIARLVIRIRAGSSGTPPIVLGGLVLHLADRIKERTGVDVVTNDVRVALQVCDSNQLISQSATGP